MALLLLSVFSSSLSLVIWFCLLACLVKVENEDKIVSLREESVCSWRQATHRPMALLQLVRGMIGAALNLCDDWLFLVCSDLRAEPF